MVNYDEVDALRRHSTAWRLLRADNAALIVSFLGRVFVDENVREIAASALQERLDDVLFSLNKRGDVTYPKAAKAYLDDWASTDAGWLRKYYPAGSDEPRFDATPALEKAVAFITGLREREFVGTESRLNTLFELLRQMVYGTETDPAKRLAELYRQRAELDAEIARVERGELTLLDPVAQRDQFQQFATMARELLSDFREVEANFRELDRAMRVQITSWDGGKGELLDEILTTRGGIADSDQGKTFGAFYDFLLSSDRQAEFAALLDQVLALDAVGSDADARLRHVHYDWLTAGERTQTTVRMLSEQLRRFLDDRVWLENRRIVELLRSVEAHAYTLRNTSDLPGMELDETAPRVVLPMERRLYTPKRKQAIDSTVVAGDVDFDSAALFEQVYVDSAELADEVRNALTGQAQIGLAAVIDGRPLQRGLAELVAYLALDDDAFTVVFDEHHRDEVSWVDDGGTRRVATVPRVSFARNGGR